MPTDPTDPTDPLNPTDLEDEFPTSEEFVDCCGQRREFTLALLDSGRGFFVRATEQVSGAGGYSFAAHSETDPWLAFSRLRQKIHEGLATRYLAVADHPPRLTHELAVGHIGFRGVVVDGRALTYNELATLLSSYEGWRFTLKIDDGYDAS